MRFSTKRARKYQRVIAQTFVDYRRGDLKPLKQLSLVEQAKFNLRLAEENEAKALTIVRQDNLISLTNQRNRCLKAGKGGLNRSFK